MKAYQIDALIPTKTPVRNGRNRYERTVTSDSVVPTLEKSVLVVEVEPLPVKKVVNAAEIEVGDFVYLKQGKNKQPMEVLEVTRKKVCVVVDDRERWIDRKLVTK